MAAREIAVLVPVIIMIIWIGVYPNLFLEKTEASVDQIIQRVEFGNRIRWTLDENSEPVEVSISENDFANKK